MKPGFRLDKVKSLVPGAGIEPAQPQGPRDFKSLKICLFCMKITTMFLRVDHKRLLDFINVADPLKGCI